MKRLVPLLLLFCLIITRIYMVKARKKNNSSHITIGLAGDTMLGRGVNEILAVKPSTYPWGNLLPLLHQTDFNLVNLETTLTRSMKKVPKVFNFRSDPKNIQSLKDAHIDAVCIANNHILDFGVEGLLETISTLDQAGIKHIGAGKNIREAQQPVIMNKNGITIGIIGYTDNEPSWIATKTQPGTNYISVAHGNTILPMLTELKKQVDFLILTIQWGPNMRQCTTREFQQFAHNVIDAGVDLLHGHSAHILQGIEHYNNGLILYDTGDFVDDYAIDPLLRNDQSCFFEITLEKKDCQIHITYVKLHPIEISNYQVNHALEPEAHEIIAHMQHLSAEFDTHITNEGTVILPTQE